MKTIDFYIIRKFLSTFFLSIILILMLVVVFDISERIEDFITKKPPLKEIIFDYYLNFIPFFANLFSPLFTFIAVIYFTSRMAYRSEIVAMMSSGISFRRILFPYLLSATVIALLSLFLNHFVIPKANGTRMAFEEAYLKNPFYSRDRNIHRQIAPGTFIYLNSFNNQRNTGYQFSLEKINNGIRYYYLRSDFIRWDSIKNRWTLDNYFVREINGMDEKFFTGVKLDTVFEFRPEEFGKKEGRIESMTTPHLTSFIEEEKRKGSYQIPYFEVEKHRRSSYPFATFILTLIGASVASKKVRGGIGWHIGLGLLFSFAYILFMQVSTTFATNGATPAWLAVWIPNVLFAFLAFVLLKMAPR